MESVNRIEIIDREGWRKEIVLEKRISYIGSDARNDIVLNPVRGSGVTPRHLQLIIAQPGPAQISIVNLSDSEVLFDNDDGKSLLPFSALDISDGAKIRLGDFLLIFHLQGNFSQPGSTTIPYQQTGKTVETITTSESIGLRAALQSVNLGIEAPIRGMIYVRNQGTAPGVQFELTLEGLPAGSFEIGAAPILFPGAEKGVPVQIFHPRRPDIPAGPHTITFKAFALDAYPGETAVVSIDLQVLPYYNHTLQLSEIG